MNIAITSASGNIGKSTICLNLSLSLNDNFENDFER
jgi:Mrp family chromosome partitioning ATPase